MNPENILWNKFLGEAPKVEFDANRYRNWRFFWDYSGGNVYENMCHQVSFWYKVLGLDVPSAVTMTGGLYLWQDGREVPDTMNVSMQQPEEILFSWVSGFGNASPGRHRASVGHGWHHLQGPADTLRARARESPQSGCLDRPNAHAPARAYAELPRLHSRRPRNQLPL